MIIKNWEFTRETCKFPILAGAQGLVCIFAIGEDIGFAPSSRSEQDEDNKTIIEKYYNRDIDSIIEETGYKFVDTSNIVTDV